MTEQQIKILKNHLAASRALPNSPELDDAILSAAEAELNAQQNGPTKRTRFASMGFAAAALSVLLTAGVFFVLGELIRVDERPEYVQRPSLPEMDSTVAVEFDRSEIVSARKHADRPAKLRPDANPVLPNQSLEARNKLLAQLKLPEVDDMVSNMTFSLEADRALAEQSVLLAMTDIRQMLDQGRMQNARQRYEQLRESCDVCTLPNSLETLVLTNIPSSDSS